MKKIILSSIVGLSILLFTGCTSASVSINPTHTYNNVDNKEVKVVRIYGYTHYIASISRARDSMKTSYLLFNIAADYTIKEGYKYFAIHAPKMISNFENSPINTMEGFMDKCSNSVAGHAGSMFDAFGLNTYACNMANINAKKGFFDIVPFKEKPKSILVYTASDVIKYLKDNDKFEADRYNLAFD